MTSWKTYRLGDVISIKSGFAYKGEHLGKGDKYLLGMGCVSFNEKFLPSGARLYAGDVPSRYFVKAGDIVLATRQQSDNLPILGMPAIIPSTYKNTFVGANLYAVQNDSDIDNNYLYWLLKTPEYIQHIKSCQTGTTVRMITKSNIESFEFKCPNRIERNRISNFLWSLENKIENNRRINANLELQAQALFDEWFVNDSTQPAEYDRAVLTDIANYLNGLAMQRFRPQRDEKGIPVLKIKELGQGQCDSSNDMCSPSIDPKYIVNDGDIIFSWSGTLLVDIWCGGICGLNQHLFKVTSDKYPKWFVYYWTKYHLAKFIRIAKDKAVTMGHIKRGDLEASEVLIPSAETLSRMDNIIAPIFDAIINKRVENRTLATLRDTLLPKLMNGEIKVE